MEVTRDKTRLLCDVEDYTDQSPRQLSSGKGGASLRSMWLYCLLAISAFMNILLAVQIRSKTIVTKGKSKFAGLSRTIEEPYVRQTHYSSPNSTLQAQLWHDINIDDGVVALSDTWVTAHNLRLAQRFPWDSSKGIYILHGYHNLHCLKIVHIALDEFRTREPQTREWHHISHCMDALRRQILCDADDTPRATERRAEVVSGVRQHRMCRSWKALEEFARGHTACYRRPERPDGKPIIERFKHCPEGSGYVIEDNYRPSDEYLIGLPEESVVKDE